jgi:hypothetical protein
MSAKKAKATTKKPRPAFVDPLEMEFADGAAELMRALNAQRRAKRVSMDELARRLKVRPEFLRRVFDHGGQAITTNGTASLLFHLGLHMTITVSKSRAGRAPGLTVTRGAGAARRKAKR